MNIGHLTAILGVNSAGLVKAQKDMLAFEKRAQASLTRINAKLATTGAAMKKVGKSMTMYLTLPMALIGGAAVKMSMDFESSMSKIVGLVGVARAQVDEWSKDIIRIAPQLGKAPKELADALFFITSAGIRGAEAMDVLTMSAKASVSGLGETKAVADLVTSAMNAYGISVLNAQLATDVLTATVREGKAEATALASTMGMVLPIASNMGVAFHEVGGAIAAMTRTGTSAATASMQLRQILASLLKPTQQAEDALWKMSTSSAALRKTIKEQGLLAALMEIRKLTAQYGETVMSTVFPNIRALSGVLDIMGANLEDNIKIFKSLEDAAGSGAKAFAAAAKTFEHRWKVATATAKTALTLFGKTIAEQLIPVLEGFAERIREVIAWWNGLNEAQKKTVIRIAALIMVTGPLLKIFGFLIGTILPKLIVGFNALTMAMLKNPWTAIATVLTIATVALVTHIKKARQAAELYKGMDRWTIKATKSTMEQKVAVEQLYRVAQNENRELKKREAALRKLNQISPEYFSNLSLETINTEKATVAKQKYIQELLREAKVKAAQEELVRLEKEAFKMLEQGEAARLNFFQKMKMIGVNAFLGVGRAAEFGARMAVENYKETEAQIEKTRKELQAFIDEILTVQDIIGKPPPTPPGGRDIPRPPEVEMKVKPFWLVDTTALVNQGAIYTNITRQLADDLVNIEKDTQERLKAIRDYYAQERLNALQEYLGAVANIANSISNLWSAQKDKELSMVGDNAKKREAIEKKYAAREKIIAMARAAIYTAVEITKVLSRPWMIALVAAAGAIQMATIAAQKFAMGGAVTGPTLGLVGEGSGISRSNPEFIGTAAQLGLDRIGNQNITITLKGAEIDGNKLVWLVDEIKRQQGNSY